MNKLPHPEGRPDPELAKINLGDIGGENERLESRAESLTEVLNVDAPKTLNTRVIELLVMVNSPGLFVTYAIFESTYNWIKKKVSQNAISEIQNQKAKVEIELTESITDHNQATTDAIENLSSAKADKYRAQAEAIRSKTVLDQIEKFKKLGIDWHAERDDEGHIKIMVSKPPKKKKKKG